MKKHKLPKYVYVRINEDSDGSYLDAYWNRDDAVEGDGPTVVGCYCLEYSDELAKTVQEVTPRARRKSPGRSPEGT